MGDEFSLHPAPKFSQPELGLLTRLIKPGVLARQGVDGGTLSSTPGEPARQIPTGSYTWKKEISGLKQSIFLGGSGECFCFLPFIELCFSTTVYIYLQLYLLFFFFLYVKWAPSMILANEWSRNRNSVHIYVEQQCIFRDLFGGDLKWG